MERDRSTIEHKSLSERDNGPGRGIIVLPAVLLLFATIGLGMRATGTTTVVWFAGPPLLGALLALGLAVRGTNTKTRGVVLRVSGVVAFLTGVPTLWSVGLILMAAGGLLLWAADRTVYGGGIAASPAGASATK